MDDSEKADDKDQLADLALRHALHNAARENQDASTDTAKLSREVHEVLDTIEHRPDERADDEYGGHDETRTNRRGNQRCGSIA